MNSNYSLIEVILSEKMEENRLVSDNLSLTKTIINQGSETKNSPATFYGILHQLKILLEFELRTLMSPSK